MATIHQAAPTGATPFVIFEDATEQEPLSPSEVFDGDVSFTSELSLPLGPPISSIIEHEPEMGDEPLPYRSSYTSRKSISQPRNVSGVTQYSFVSAIPSESSISSKPVPTADVAVNTRYTPQKDRPRFRNPESVRAMQMASPPPLSDHEASRERIKGAYKLGTPVRSETPPVSRRAGSRRGSVQEHHSPRPSPALQQAPLVLLHVTILPMKVPFSHDLMIRIMPDWLVENYKVLEEKLQDIILMRRGLLIPHPRDEYDLLEERILESLELKTPRLLKCGHFVAPEDDSDREEESDTSSVPDDNTGRGSRMSGGTLTEDGKWEERLEHPDDSVCHDCNRELKRPGKGVGAGTRKWDIKIYAANGLMRAAAWTACWNDMERCDVEISPWIPDDVRKTLERRVQEEQDAEKRKQMYALELQRQIQEAAVKQKILEEDAIERRRREEVELRKNIEAAAAAALEKSVEDKAAEQKRAEGALEEKIEQAKAAVRQELEIQAQAESSAIAERFRVLEAALKEQKDAAPAPRRRRTSSLASTTTSARQHAPSHTSATANIPLPTLLKNYLLVLLADQRNVLILVLSLLLVFVSLSSSWSRETRPVQQVDRAVLLDSRAAAAYTATMTATEVATVTVTEMQIATAAAAAVPRLRQGKGKGGVRKRERDVGFSAWEGVLRKEQMVCRA